MLPPNSNASFEECDVRSGRGSISLPSILMVCIYLINPGMYVCASLDLSLIILVPGVGTNQTLQLPSTKCSRCSS